MKTILSKLLLYIISPLILIYFIQTIVNISIGRKFILDTFEEKMITNARNYALIIDEKLKILAETANQTAKHIEALDQLSEKEIYELLKSNVSSDTMIYGAAIAFVPESYKKIGLFSPYVFRRGDSLKAINIGTESYDYSDGNWDWYSLPVKTGNAVWTEPYFDKGAGNIKMCTYSVPFYKNGKIWGVATVDIAIEPLEKLISPDNLKYKSFGFIIISKSGKFIYHPSKEHILKDNILSMTKSGILPEDQKKIGEKMIAGETGTMEIYDTSQNAKKLAFYAPVKTSGWSISASLNENEAYSSLNAIENNITISFIAALTLIIFSIYIVSKKITRPILRLKDATQNFARGKLDDSVLLESKDEIGALSKSFSFMAVQLQEREAAQISLLDDVNKRVKELQCLYKVSQLTENIQNPVEFIIDEIVKAIPAGWQFPENTGVRINFLNIEKSSGNFKTSKWIQSADIFAEDKELGKIEVVLMGNEIPEGKTPFLSEEKKLIETIAVMISGFWQRKTNSDKLIKANEKLEAKVKARTKDLEVLLVEVNSLNSTLASQNLALNASTIVSMTDANGILQHVNEEFCKVSKYSKEELIGKNYSILNSGFHPKEFWKSLWDIISAGKIWRSEILNKAKDGSLFWVDTVIAPILDKNGKPKQYFTIRFDVTDKKNAEELLNETKERLDLALSSANMGLWEYYIEENRFVTELVNDTKDHTDLIEFDGSFNEWLNNIYYDDRIRVLENVKRAIETGEKYSDEYRILNKGNQLKYFTTRGIFFRNEEGKIYHGTGLTWDITSEKNAAEELARAKAEAESATQAKSRFLATMSHEIRTPMNAIIGFSNLALQTELNYKQKDYVEKIDRSAHSLLDIINDILDFSKIEEGKLNIENIEFDLEYVIDGVSNLISPKAQNKGLEFIIHIAPDVPLNLVGDPLRIGQIITNFCSNAVKFTEKGEIVVSADLVNIEEDNVKIKFSVTDTGIGLKETEKRNLFKSFSQADSSTTRKYGGTGLGLAICKNLSNLMNGEIGFISEFEKGSTFYFTCGFGLPKNQKMKEYVPSIDLRGMRVLVCDDNSTTRKILREALETFTFKVTTVSSGIEALNELKKNEKTPYELVLMDWKMPEIDGIETTRRIKKEVKTNTPTVIMVTAFGRDIIAKKAKEEGINAFLIKPVSYSTLFDTIMEVFGKEVRTRKQKPAIGEKYFSEMEIRSKSNILLVEDNEINQQIVTELLTNVGLNVETADNGKIALEKIKNSGNPSKYDLVFIDLQMPEMDGFTATKEIRKIEAYRKLPVIAITADAMVGTKEKCLESGMNDMITKPVHPDEIFAKIKEFVNPKLEISGSAVPEKQITGISEFEHINIKSGIERIGNNRKLFDNLLLGFFENNKSVVEEVRKAADSDEIEILKRLVHTIKGVAGNLGMEKLQIISSELEKEIESGKGVDFKTRLNDFEVETESVLKEISEWKRKIQPLGEVSNLTITVADLKKRLITIRNLLVSSDFTAVEEINSLVNLKGAEFCSRELQEISTLINKFDFDKADEAIEYLLKKID